MGKVEIPTSEDGAGLICLERNRQQIEYQWDDSRHPVGHLASQAAVLADSKNDRDAWGIKEKHPERIEQLIIAGALIAAEIDRLLESR